VASPQQIGSPLAIAPTRLPGQNETIENKDGFFRSSVLFRRFLLFQVVRLSKRAADTVLSSIRRRWRVHYSVAFYRVWLGAELD
jgi:hypothetical protein